LGSFTEGLDDWLGFPSSPKYDVETSVMTTMLVTAGPNFPQLFIFFCPSLFPALR
jgi:hypothetical protein